MRRYKFLFLTLGLALGVLGLALVLLPASGQAAPAEEAGQVNIPLEARREPALQETATPTATVPVSQGIPLAPEAVATPGGQLPTDIQVDLVKVTDGLDDPVNVVSAGDGSGRLFVVERKGTIRVVADGELLEEPFLDISGDVMSAFLEQGLYDIAFHPNFASNGRFYVHYAELMRNGDSLIVEYTVSDEDPNVADPDSARAILQIEQPWANHNGGELAFGPDGYLYIGSGDGGWEGDPLSAGQDLSTLLGKILRIDVDNGSPERPYAIPAGNPFTAPVEPVRLFGISEETFAQLHTEARPEIWAYGLRNPWKFDFDPATGDLYIAEVGQNVYEEIDLWPAGRAGGQNYGWDFRMGTHCFPVQAESCPQVGVLPIAEYSHDLGRAVVGIGVYRGNQFPALDGVYFAGDWGSGRVWGLAQDEDGAWQMEQLLDTDLKLTGAGRGNDGTLYVTSCKCEYGQGNGAQMQPGALWQILPRDQVDADAEVAASANSPYTTSLELVAEGLAAPVAYLPAPDDSGRHFIVDQAGLIRIVDADGELLDEPFLDLRDRMVTLQSGYDERGLLGLAFHPDYADNGRFFVYYSAPLRDEAPANWDHTSHLSAFTVSPDNPNAADPDSEQILLQIDEPQLNHDAGQIAFGPDGYLYVPLGDGGNANDEGTGHVPDWYDANAGGNGQDVDDNLLGSILRLDVDGEGEAGRPYAIPADNPFADGEGGLPEIWAYGFRNPFRISFDMGGDNALFVSDAGQNRWEEVSIVEAGGNYGWNVKEGTHCFSTTNPNASPASCPDSDPEGDTLIDPIIEYANANQPGGVGLVVIGGHVYRGDAFPSYQGAYIFGDWSDSFQSGNGQLFIARPPAEAGEMWQVHDLWITGQENGNLDTFLLSFGQDADGEVYVLTSDTTGPTGDTGKVYKLVPPAGEAEEAETETGAATTESTVTIADFAFSPETLTVPVGTTVVWTNEDTVAHTVTTGTPGDPSGTFDSGNLNQGDTFSYTFDEPGSFAYFCTIHPSMTATVVVEE